MVGHTLLGPVSNLQPSSRNVVRNCWRWRAFRPARNVGTHVSRSPAVLAVSVVDDKSVPEAHKGLHGFLYGEGGSEQHDQEGAYAVRTGEDEGSVVMTVPAYLESRDGEKPLGVYCVYDNQLQPQYIGYSRNMVLAIKGHLARVGPERAAHVRAMVYGNKAMASRSNLERGVENWIQELLGGQVPLGNTDLQLRALWEGITVPTAGGDGSGGSDSGGSNSVASAAVLDRSLMSAGELAAYEEKKLKMRKAMGEKMVGGPGSASGTGSSSDHHGQHDHDHGEEEEEQDDPATRRLKLMAAMNRGDWSAVINAQTQETLPGAEGGGEAAAGAPGAGTEGASTSGDAAGARSEGGSSSGGGGSGGDEAGKAGAAGAGGIVSPFQKDAGAAAAAAAAGGGGGGGGRPPLTVQAVQAALEEVRPYLMADGGDVEVAEVKDGVVYLRLQGACSSCPSQSATMKGGIERVIRQTFGDQVRDILQLDATDPRATVERVDAALDMLRGAIFNFGGFVEVVAVEDGVCTIRYKGPPAIGKGVQGAVKDTFSDLREVRLVD